jgi:hypothetical protein
MMYMYLQKVISKNAFEKNLLFVGILGRSMTKIAGSDPHPDPDSNPDSLGRGMDPWIQIRIRRSRSGSGDPDPDPDPPQNIMDPQHCS